MRRRSVYEQQASAQQCVSKGSVWEQALRWEGLYGMPLCTLGIGAVMTGVTVDPEGRGHDWCH